MTHFNQGVKQRLLAAVKNKIISKHKRQVEEALCNWIEEVTSFNVGTDFQRGLKNGLILCELINKLQPGSVKVINISLLNWPQLENISNFIQAIQAYGMKPYDIFEANDLFENKNMTQVRSTLVALAGLAKKKGFNTMNCSLTSAEKLASCFDRELRAERNVIGMQKGTNRYGSQVGMTIDGVRGYLYYPPIQTDKLFDRTAVGPQMDNDKGTSLAGMLAQGCGRDINEQKLTLGPMDFSTISPQMGTKRVASQEGMSVYGLGQQVYDDKYFAALMESVIPNGSHGTGTNGSEIRESDYQAEFPDEYHDQYQDGYSRDYLGIGD